LTQIWVALLVTVVFFSPASRSEQTETDSALWGGGLALVQTPGILDYSAEYQFRLADDMSTLNNHFVEFLGYHNASENLLLNGGYRYTRRSSRNEHRLYMGGFIDLTRSGRGLDINADQFRATLQVGYQHDFNVAFDDEVMDSDSVRFILIASKPLTEKVRPFVLGGVLTTWNDAYNFGVDKIRLGGGFHYQFTNQSRLRIQYIWEKARFRSPEKQTNILWLRYEVRIGA
jgi:hypothetical protein